MSFFTVLFDFGAYQAAKHAKTTNDYRKEIVMRTIVLEQPSDKPIHYSKLDKDNTGYIIAYDVNEDGIYRLIKNSYFGSGSSEYHTWLDMEGNIHLNGSRSVKDSVSHFLKKNPGNIAVVIEDISEVAEFINSIIELRANS